MDESQAAGIERALGRVEAALKGQTDWQNGHDADDKLAFSEIRRNFADQSQRLGKLELIADTIDGHGAAITDIEQRVSEAEEREKIRVVTGDTNRAWIRWIFLLVAALTADHFTGSKLAAWVARHPEIGYNLGNMPPILSRLAQWFRQPAVETLRPPEPERCESRTCHTLAR